MRPKSLVALLLILAVPAARADLIEISFEGFAHGTTLAADQYSSQGVKIGMVGAAGAGATIWALNLESYGQGGFGSQGNVISPTSTRVAVDDGPFYDMDFRFSTAVDFFSIVALDVDVESYRFLAYLGDTLVSVTETRVETGNYRIINPYLGNSIGGPIFSNTLGQIGGSVLFDRVVIDLDASGPEAWDSLRFNTVPEPGTLGLLGLGLAGLGFARRRKHV